MNLEFKKLFLLILLIFNIILALAISKTFTVAIFLILIFFLLNYIVKSNKTTILFSFLIGITVTFFFYNYWSYFYGSGYYLGSYSDDYNYDIFWSEGFIEKYGIDITKITKHLNELRSGLGDFHNSKGYVATIIFLRYFSSFFDGYHTLMPRILNILFLSLTAYYSSHISYYYINSRKIQKITFLSVFFFPVMLFNSVHVFRDTIVSFLLVYIYYYLLINRKSLVIYVKIIPFLVILFYFRSIAFFIGLLMILILSFNFKSVLKQGLIAFAIFFIFGYFFFSDFLNLLLQQTEKYTELNTERLGSIGSKIFDLPIYIGIIPRIIYLIFVPVPGISSFHQIYISISTILQVAFFPFLFWGLIKKDKDSKLTLVFLLFFLGIAMSTATFRHVMMYLPFGIIFTIISYHKEKLSFKSYRYIFTVIFLFIVFSGSLLLALYF